jgi:hypothetical protein
MTAASRTVAENTALQNFEEISREECVAEIALLTIDSGRQFGFFEAISSALAEGAS